MALVHILAPTQVWKFDCSGQYRGFLNLALEIQTEPTPRWPSSSLQKPCHHYSGAIPVASAIPIAIQIAASRRACISAPGNSAHLCDGRKERVVRWAGKLKRNQNAFVQIWIRKDNEEKKDWGERRTICSEISRRLSIHHFTTPQLLNYFQDGKLQIKSSPTETPVIPPPGWRRVEFSLEKIRQAVEAGDHPTEGEWKCTLGTKWE